MTARILRLAWQDSGVAESEHGFSVGGIFEGCLFHPVRCTDILLEDDRDLSLEGIGLTDGQWSSGCSLARCGPIPLTEVQGQWIVAHLEEYVARRTAGEEPEDIFPESLTGP